MAVNIDKVLNILKARTGQDGCSYYIPKAWNCSGFDSFTTTPGRPGEILVDPYAFMLHSIENGILGRDARAGNTAGKSRLTGGIMYSMLPRMFTAWHHGKGEELSPGTFLKTICLIPHLMKMNIDILYLLPIFKHSDRYKKGTLGSPYAIKNIYMLDERLHDGLLGGYSEELLETEFKAFVEACHLSGIKVMVDFVFRTVARDNDLIMTHPDWFYWIDAKQKDTFQTPYVESLKPCTYVSDQILENIYTCSGISKYLASFRMSPDKQDPQKWARIMEECRSKKGNILEYIEESFGISTAPGFPDVINDSQPPWTDATYLRYYFDVNDKVKKYITETQAPYILQDGAKLNLYRGNEKNEDLWEYIAGAIPHYQTQFGIDGARIDMGHALPPELNREIIGRARKLDPGFILWSEEFNVKNSARAKKDGFDFITSTVSFRYKDIGKRTFNRKLMETLHESQVPVTGALETPDTPRASCYYRDKGILKLLTWLNCFIPNAIHLINNGQELVEIQPMNLGIDNTAEGRFMLEKGDPMYGKLAFFDNYCLHWLNSDKEWMTGLLAQATTLRKQYDRLISDKSNFIEQPGIKGSTKLITLCYFNKRTGENIFLMANCSSKMKNGVIPADILPGDLASKVKDYSFVFREMKGHKQKDLNKKLWLSPYEVLIGQFK